MGKISYSESMGKPCNDLVDRKEHFVVLSIRHRQRSGAVSPDKVIEPQIGMHRVNDPIYLFMGWYNHESPHVT